MRILPAEVRAGRIAWPRATSSRVISRVRPSNSGAGNLLAAGPADACFCSASPAQPKHRRTSAHAAGARLRRKELRDRIIAPPRPAGPIRERRADVTITAGAAAPRALDFPPDRPRDWPREG